MSPDGESVYVGAGVEVEGRSPSSASSIAVLDRDPVSGALAQLAGSAGCLAPSGYPGCGPARGLNEGTSALALSPDGRNAYAIFDTLPGPGGLGVYRRDPATGALTELPGRRACLSAGGGGGCTRARAIEKPEAVTVSADGRNVYVTSFNSHETSIFVRRPGSGALRQRQGRAGCIGGLPGPPIPGPLGGVFNVDQGCADAAVGGTDLELTRDGVYGYAPGDGTIVTLARDAPRVRVRIGPRRCLTANSTATVAVIAYAPLRRVTVRLDGHVIANTRRQRFRVPLSPGQLTSRRSLSVVAADIRGRLSHAKGRLRNCVG